MAPMRFLMASLVALLLIEHATPAAAQECRRTCRVDETRDNNGCCIPPPTVATPPVAPVAAPLPRRCPAGTTWSEGSRACMGRLTCPSGSHPEEGHGCVADAVGCPAGSRAEEGRCVADVPCPP